MLVNVGTAHLNAGGGFAEGQALAHLIEIATALPAIKTDMALVLSDKDISAADLVAFKSAITAPVLIENQTSPQTIGTYFDQADGLILEAETRKKSVIHPELPPTIDMARVEGVVNRLRNVVPVSEMDPDIFLSR